ncbi:NADH-ubiquinone oxidoreductase-F iron-sulfur binding region domain-containing protein [Actinomarinicola tropica]|uniref:NADH ubiquinone oxidoreductase n=1 Tax=Actinomarinicola tropica TaxID=2789776 RepID=A0A5Q2REM7_9ACTN|nr:NADH-ubiquinone oxidoreductase-F iron-sulfur binding region domain-containing protein [Actinomarinicola tropica]QGG94103.1 NADH ubiquinone oxidoreductase [Actinomarinicola tropica]
MSTQPSALLAGDGVPVESLDAYLALGGGEAFERARAGDPDAIVEELRRAGLRGRGGAGFPTAIKWGGVRADPAPTKFVCANGAEGEPGTFKDRYLLRMNPYQVIEGLAIARHVIGAKRAYLCVKRLFASEVARVRSALDELAARSDMAEAMELVLGPDEYLFGEEKALLSVVEGGLPLPRLFPPHVHGLFGPPYGDPSGGQHNPTVVNNLETLAHVPQIVRRGADWFRGLGTSDTPGTMLFTVSGDVQRPLVIEQPLGLTLRELVDDVAGGPPPGRRVKAVFAGLASAVVTGNGLDTPLSFDTMRRAGSALGSGGFIVYDDTACMVQVAWLFSRFLHVESCGQCPPCKLGSQRITERLDRLLDGSGKRRDLDDIAATVPWVPNGQRCALATSESVVIGSILAAFPEDFEAHLRSSCELGHDRILPKMTDYVPGEGFTYDRTYWRKQPDWTYQDP